MERHFLRSIHVELLMTDTEKKDINVMTEHMKDTSEKTNLHTSMDLTWTKKDVHPIVFECSIDRC